MVWDEEETEDMQGMLDQHGLLMKLALGAADSVGEVRVSDKQKQLPIQD
jgi:hypothetical protein